VSRHKVPVRVKPRQVGRALRPAASSPVCDPLPPVMDADEVPAPAARSEEKPAAAELEAEMEMWRDRALRLEAEMENFRKRTRRLAEESVAADRERLLRAFLTIGDDLARAISTDGVDADGLREGVNITYNGLLQLLDQEGVEPILAEGWPFDPTVHEAVSTVSHREKGVEPNTVVEEVEKGYRLGERLLRPAKVIVAT